jgi:septum formation protein
MLSRLAGRTHEVHTAVALRHAGGAAARVSTSSVSLRALAPGELDWYCRSGEPDDKAGGYAVQGRAALFIRHIAGSYSGIMGLPLYETWELLAPVLGPPAGEVRP